MTEDKTRVFNGGISTDPELKRLIEATRDIQVGSKYSDAWIQEIIGEKVGSHRYQGVVDRFRHRMYKEHNFLVRRERCVGYYVANASERAEKAWDDEEKYLRGMKRAYNILIKTDRAQLDTEFEKLKYDHTKNKVGRLLIVEAEENARFKISAPGAVKTLCANCDMKKGEDD